MRKFEITKKLQIQFNLPKKILLVCIVLLNLVFCFFSADMVIAEDQPGVYSTQRIIHVLGTRSLPPYCFLSEKGEPSGFLIDVLKAISANENFNIEIKLHSDESLFRPNTKKQIDMYVGVSLEETQNLILHQGDSLINTSRSNFSIGRFLTLSPNDVSGKELSNYHFFIPVLEMTFSSFGLKAKGSMKKDLLGKDILVKEHSYAHRYVKKEKMIDNIIPVDSYGAALYGIVSEEADSALMERFHGQYLINKLNLKNIRRTEQPLFLEEMGFVVTKGNLSLVENLQKGLKKIESSGAFEKLYEKWFEKYSRPLFDGIFFLKVLCVPITIFLISLIINFSLKRKVSRIIEERERIFDFTRDGIVAVDREGKISLLNRKAIELAGLEGNEKGLGVDNCIPELGLTDVLKTVEAVNDYEHNVNGRILVTNKAPVKVRGEVTGAIATFRDTTEIRAMAQEITGVKMYVESLRVQNHEFLNKLQAIAGLIQMGRSEKAIQFISSEQQEWQSTTSFVSEHIENFVVGGILVGKIGKCRELGIDFKIDPDSSCGENTSVGDQVLVIVIGNLFENAIESLKYLKGRKPLIEFAVFDESHQIMISLRDNGQGIKNELREKVFEKGFSTKTCGKSCGYGLYSIRMMVEALKGDIFFDSVPGEYAEFIVTLPNGGVR